MVKRYTVKNDEEKGDCMRLQEIREKRTKTEVKLTKILKEFEDSIGGASVSSIHVIRSDRNNVVGLEEIVDTDIVLKVH